MTTVTSFQNGSFTSGSSIANTGTTFGGVDYSSFYNTDYLDRKYDYNKVKDSYETKDSAEDSSIETKISNILYLIESGYEDKAMEAYSALLETMGEQSQYSTLSEDELQAAAKSLLDAQVEEDTEGEYTNVSDYIVEYAADAGQNSTQKVLWKNSKVDETTEEDLLREICGIDTDDTVSAGRKIGNFLLNVVTLGFGTELFDFSKHH